MPIEVQEIEPDDEMQQIIREAFPSELRHRKRGSVGSEPDENGSETSLQYEDENDTAFDEAPSTDDLSPGTAAALATVLWLFPLTAMFIGLDWAAHQQYRQSYPLRTLTTRVANMLPALSLYVFLTLRYQHSHIVRATLFLCSALGGSYMIYLANRASYFTVILRCPALGVLWIWSIIQLDLLVCLGSLGVVGLACWANSWSVISSPR